MKTKHKQAAKAKHKRKYQADNASIYWVMVRTQLYTPAEQAKLQTPVYLALDAMTHGSADENDMGTLCRVCNVCLILGEKIGPVAVDVANEALEALARAEQRLYQHGHYGLDGEGRNALTTCLDYHDQLIAECTPAQLREAQAEMHRRAARGHAVRVTEEGVAA